MAAKSFRELVNLSSSELELKLKDLREELFTLRFRNSMRQLDNALKIRSTRRDIARVLMLQGKGDANKGGPA
ncbi:MAG: 50S ribosomal protein L29 [Candidatus Eisenbacteria bacterium]